MDHCKPSDQSLAKLQERYAKAKKKERSRIGSIPLDSTFEILDEFTS